MAGSSNAGPADSLARAAPSPEPGHDELTGLLDDAAFRGAVTLALDAARAGRAEMAILVLDLDHYRSTRERLGAAAGDAVLGAVAGRLAATLRHGDVLARLGDDRLGVLIRDIGDAEDATMAAGRLVAACRRPFAAMGQQVLINLSIGIAIGGIGTEGGEELLRDAEVAMTRARADGGDRWATFEPGMHELVLARFELEAELAQAIAAGQLALDFQPLVHLPGALGQAGRSGRSRRWSAGDTLSAASSRRRSSFRSRRSRA